VARVQGGERRVDVQDEYLTVMARALGHAVQFTPPSPQVIERSQTWIHSPQKIRAEWILATGLYYPWGWGVAQAMAGSIKLAYPGSDGFFKFKVGYAGRKQRYITDLRKVTTMEMGAQGKVAMSFDRTAFLGGVPPKTDERVLPLGRIYRVTSLDELPQLGDVVWRKMNLVGRRAYDEKELAGVEMLCQNHLDPRLGIGEREKAILAIYLDENDKRHSKPAIWGPMVLGKDSTITTRLLGDMLYEWYASLRLDLWLTYETWKRRLFGIGAR